MPDGDYITSAIGLSLRPKTALTFVGDMRYYNGH